MDNSSSTSTTKEPRNTATLSRKERKTQKFSDMGSAGQESLAVILRSRRQERHGRSRRSKKSSAAKKMPMKEDITTTTTAAAGATATEEEEKFVVENKILALQKIVPGGESLGVDKLFEETAEYILELQYQVKALKFLASFVEGSDKEKRKFGG